MTVHLMHLFAYMDDGQQLEVHADQRDMRRAFITLGIQDPDRDTLGFPRACAWAYLHRVGVINGMGWKDFDAQTIEVSPPDDDDEDEAGEPVQAVTEVDPTGPGPAGKSPSSPPPPASPRRSSGKRNRPTSPPS